MAKKIGDSEWFSAVYLAHSMLELDAYPAFDISKEDLKIGAMQLLRGLIDKHDGLQPSLSQKTKEIIALINAHAVSDIAKNGGGRH